MITIRGRQYHIFPTINPEGIDEEKCLGCTFEKADGIVCESIMRELNHEGCADASVVFVKDNDKQIARYIAARMGANGEKS